MELSLINNVTPDLYAKLCQLAETGKWFDGKPMTEHQHETVQQAVMAYQARVAESHEHMNVGSDGQIVHQSKRELKQQFSKQDDIIRVNHDDL